jgi:hypothetical protein
MTQSSHSVGRKWKIKVAMLASTVPTPRVHSVE